MCGCGEHKNTHDVKDFIDLNGAKSISWNQPNPIVQNPLPSPTNNLSYDDLKNGNGNSYVH